ncbi:hypothetical protein [Pseudomonas syringae]|uniref:hypothetical protein n=1 Tax=Pseudomonas syringae TaxID=317 RepID=UPI00301CFF7A
MISESETQPLRLRVRGTHGTSLSRAQQIDKDGFQAKPGRIGVGAYFWTAIVDTEECLDLAKKLARTWATKAEKGGQYAGDKERSLAIVEVDVEFEVHDVLSLDNPEMTFRLWSLIREKLASLLGLRSETDWAVASEKINKLQGEIHGFIEAFVLELEENLGRRFKVIFKSQACPKYSDPILHYIGNHSCFAIRDTSVIGSMNITN